MTGAAPRVLVIAYDFPPHGAIGTMRTLRLVRRLHEEGWQVTVLTGHPETYLPGTPVEPSLEALVPEGVRVLSVRAVRPYNRVEAFVRGAVSTGRARPQASGPSTARQNDGNGAASAAAAAGRRRGLTRWILDLRDRVEGALEVPDKESGWMAPAVLRGLRHMREAGAPDVIYSSAPPWSGQLVALALARASRRPWLADFRDPWARAPWRDWQPLRRRAIAALERRVIRRADGVLFVTAANLQEFTQAYGAGTANKFRLVPNGCDPAELDAISGQPAADRFVLLHAGTLYGARSPLPVIRAMGRALARRAIDPERFRLRLLGTASLPDGVPAECRRLGVEPLVEIVPRVSRAESLRQMKSASALLLIQTGTTVSIPGKAYEYLAAGRPILAISEEGETAALVRESGAGLSVTADAPVETIESALLEIMSKAAAGFVPAPPRFYDGRVHAATAASLLRDLARGGRRALVTSSVPAVRRAGSTEEVPL